MTNYEAKLFNELLTVSWEMEHGNYSPIMKAALLSHYHSIVTKLEDSMGRDEWRNFISTGRQMFAPVGGYGDESPEEVERMMEAVK